MSAAGMIAPALTGEKRDVLHEARPLARGPMFAPRQNRDQLRCLHLDHLSKPTAPA
jgi:hypothetical protein